MSVAIDRATFAIAVTAEGKNIDLGAATQAPGKIVCRRPLIEGEQLFGLGASESKGLGIRGLRITGDPDLILSSAGYGLVYRTPGNYVYDLGATEPGMMRVVLNGADSMEEFFYYGASPKEIFETRRQQLSLDELPSEYLRILSERELPGDVTHIPEGGDCEFVRSLAQLSMSGRLYPAADLAKAPSSIAPLLPSCIRATAARRNRCANNAGDGRHTYSPICGRRSIADFPLPARSRCSSRARRTCATSLTNS